jgi:hypothetical protein
MLPAQILSDVDEPEIPLQSGPGSKSGFFQYSKLGWGQGWHVDTPTLNMHPLVFFIQVHLLILLNI